jgi:hypothetical protein
MCKWINWEDDMVKWILYYGEGCYLYFIDISHAYKNLRVDPIDWPLTGLSWDNHLFVDILVAFRLMTGAMFFQRVTNAVRYIMSKKPSALQ